MGCFLRWLIGVPCCDGSISAVFELEDVILPIVPSFSYLGFVFSPQCVFSMHTRALCVKARSRIGMLFCKIPLKSLPLSTVISLFNIYILPIFRYGLFIWFDHSSPSAKKMLDPIFTCFLKRYLGLPYCANNALLYHVTNTIPFSHRLQMIVQRSYFNTKFPQMLSGYKPSYFSSLSSSPPPFDPIPLVPPHFWLNPLPVFNKDFNSRRSFFRMFFKVDDIVF